MVAGVTADLVIRPYHEADLDGLMDLWAECYGAAAVNREAWLHRHFGLPQADQGMMVAVATGRLVGMQPMECYGFRLQGQSLKGAVLTGVMVSPAYRRRGIFTRLVAACEERAWDLGAAFVTTMPNERSHPGFLKRGYVDPGERRLFVLPLDSRALAHRRLGTFGRAMAPLVAAGTRLLWPPRPPAPWNGTIRQPEAFDDDHAQPAEAMVAEWPGLVQVRNADWLNWRYRPQSPTGYMRFVAQGSTGRTEALAVTAREERNGIEVGYIVDFAGIDAAALESVLNAATSGLAETGTEAVLAVVSSRSQMPALRRVGFRAIPRSVSPKRFLTVFTPAPRAKHDLSLLTEIDNWYQTLGDWDTI